KASKAFVNGDVSALSDGRATTMDAFLEVAVYSGMKPTGPVISADRWRENLGNIAWMLQRVARRYATAAAYGGEYNAFKHGLRVLTGTSEIRISATPDSAAEHVLAQSEDSLRFLELKTDPSGEKRV